MVDDKYVGLALAITAGIAIGTSIVITKKGLLNAADNHGYEGKGHEYFKSPIWWAGMATMGVGEFANFAAYAFAPAILVTPLGALSVLVGAVLGSYILHERLGQLGKIGCAIALLGSIIIVLHAPPDKDVQTIDEILHYAIQPGKLQRRSDAACERKLMEYSAFLIYSIFVTIFSAVMIYQVAPKYGRKNPLYYLSICATVGSISVMSIKAFGIAVKLTLRGDNQFTHPSTYAFGIVTVVAILTQLNYFNKALTEFTPSMCVSPKRHKKTPLTYARVNALYYVTFTTAVLIASFLLFNGFNTTDAINTMSLLCGFITIFLGVWILNIANRNPNAHPTASLDPHDALPTDGLSAIPTRYSMQSQRSFEHRRSMSASSIVYSPRTPKGDREGLMRAYDAENQQFGLTDLAEDVEGEAAESRPNGSASHLMNGRV